MAALSEADMVKILGPDYRAIEEAAQKSRGVFEEERALRLLIDTQDGRLFSAYVLMIVGVALLVSTYYTALGNQYWIQGAFGVAALVCGAALLIYLRKSLVVLRAQGDVLHQATKLAATPA